jgi:CHAT domain-containing protein
VTVAPSASMWWATRRRPATGPGRPLLVSGPDLIHAETELAAIAAQYLRRPAESVAQPAENDGPVVMCGANATLAAIQPALDGAPIAHLAAHGHHEPDNVLFSRLNFADGPLMAYDIARLNTPPAHVTLSACDVGQSTVAVGDETLGFTAALLYAGTRTVISCVAKVEHEAAADIMTTYHRGVISGLAPAGALAEASQRQPLSPFVCYGAG